VPELTDELALFVADRTDEEQLIMKLPLTPPVGHSLPGLSAERWKWLV
jgi:hypothetical protein